MSDTEGQGGKPDESSAKAEQLSAEALEAGRKFVQTDMGRQLADATDTAFAKAEELAQRAKQSEWGQKTLASDFGQQATEFAAEASANLKEAIPNTLGRNMAIGAAAGAVIALPVPVIGWIFGAVVGAGVGFMRTVTKKS